MEDFDLNLVAKKSVKSIFALVSRTFLVQLLAIVANFVLAIYLSPSAFGVFFIVSAIITFLNYFSDIGLAASLIQKKEEPTTRDLRTVFTVQQLLVLCIVVPAFLLSGVIRHNFKIDDQGIILFYAFLASFVLSSLKTIPTVILERKLDFHKLVIPQIAENLVYSLALIVFAVKGFGITSFTIAVLARAIVGLVAMYVISPWKVGVALDRKILRHLLSFGVPFQLNSFLGLLKDDLINIYIGKVLPLAQVGYIGFAQKWAFMPLRLIMDNVIKIIFPSFSRLQHDPQSLKIVIEKSLFMISLFIFPIAVGFITLSPYLIEFIPKYHKWAPALLALSLFSLNTVFGSLSTPISNFLSAIGKVKITVYFMVGWTILSWTLTPLFIKLFGYNGVALASLMVAMSTTTIYFAARKYIKFSFVRPIIKPLITSIIMGVFIFATRPFISSLGFLFIESIAALGVYIMVLSLLTKSEVKNTIILMKSIIRS